MSLLTVETGSGGASSNAYLAASDMQAYFALVGVDISGWGVPRIEQRIALATRYMVARYRNRWQGRRVTAIQALDWPRYSVFIDLGQPGEVWWPGFGPGTETVDNTVPSNVVPQEIISACAELAFRADFAFDVTNGGAAGLYPDLQPRDEAIVRESIGPLSVSYDSGANPMPVYSYCDLLLRPYFRVGGSQVSLVRG